MESIFREPPRYICRTIEPGSGFVAINLSSIPEPISTETQPLSEEGAFSALPLILPRAPDFTNPSLNQSPITNQDIQEPPPSYEESVKSMEEWNSFKKSFNKIYY